MKVSGPLHVGQVFGVSFSSGGGVCCLGLRIMKSPAAWISSHGISCSSPSLFSMLRETPVLPMVKATSLTVPTWFPSPSMIFIPRSLSLVTVFSFCCLDKAGPLGKKRVWGFINVDRYLKKA